MLVSWALNFPLFISSHSKQALASSPLKTGYFHVLLQQNGVVTPYLGHLSIDSALGGYPKQQQQKKTIPTYNYFVCCTL